MNNKISISVIGAGNMGTAIIQGLLKAGYCDITAFDSDQTKINQLSGGVKISKAPAIAEITIIAVKPNTIKEVLALLPKTQKTLLISVAAGVTVKSLRALLDQNYRIARVMPNIPAVVGQACSAIYSENQKDAEIVKEIFSTIGQCFIFNDEKQIDVATALCGSGPAFVALFIEALAKAAIELGFEQEIADKMALQTAYGTCAFLVEQVTSPKRLQEMVSSPGGTTLAGLKNLEDHDFQKVVGEALQAATKRAREIASQH